MGYTMANSLEMQGVTPGSYRYYATSPWRYLFNVLKIVFIALAILMIVLMVRRTKDAKQHPELYKSRKKSNN